MTLNLFHYGDIFGGQYRDPDVQLRGAPSLSPVRASTLVVALSSYHNAGNWVQLVTRQLAGEHHSEEVGFFRPDDLKVYTRDRPMISFHQTEVTDYQAHRFPLHEVHDLDATPFLLLSGPEPDLRWDELAEEIYLLAKRFRVKRIVILQAIPTPQPHTRPIWVSEVASASDLVSPGRALSASGVIKSSFSTSLIARIGQRDVDIIGLVAHVPHYLAEIEYPDVAIALVNNLSRRAGLSLSTSYLRELSREFHTALDPQLDAAEMLDEVLPQYEALYDSVAVQDDLPDIDQTGLPSADEIAREFEQFLASYPTIPRRLIDPDTIVNPDDGSSPRRGAD